MQKHLTALPHLLRCDNRRAYSAKLVEQIDGFQEARREPRPRSQFTFPSRIRHKFGVRQEALGYLMFRFISERVVRT